MNPAETRVSDAVVIGAAVTGLACAHDLARAGRSVAVFEHPSIRGASAAAAGMLSPWAELPREAEHLGQRERSLALYPAWIEELQEECGRPIDMRRCGSLVIALEDEPPVRERLAPYAASIPGLHFLDPREARIEAPILAREIAGAALLPEEGYVDPPDLLDALRAACVHRGVRFLGEEVLEITVDGDRATGVRASEGHWQSEATINAAGAWAGRFTEGSTTGDEVRPVRGQILVLAPSPDILPLRRVVQGNGIYLVPRGEAIVAGATSREAGFDDAIREEDTSTILERAARIAPSLRGCRIREERAGLRPHRPAGPRFGPDRNRRGLWHAIGLYRHGILMAPLAARRIREQVLAT
jgi:glycine oxidase